MKNNFLKILLPLLLISSGAIAAGKALVSSNNQTAMPVAGAQSDGTMAVLKVDSSGVLQVNGAGGGASVFTDLTDVPSSYSGQAGNFVKVNSGETGLEFGTTAGLGDVVGPASATDNAVCRYDGTTGKLIQNSSVSISDVGAISAGSLSLTTPLSDANVANNITVDQATTATALAGNGTNCSAGSFPLGVDASGNAESCTVATTGTVTSVATGTGLTGGTITGSGTIALSYSTTQGSNPSLSQGQAVFDSGDAQGGLLFEGFTANNFEGLLTVTDPTADDVWTLPDVTGTLISTGNISDISGLTDSQVSDTLTASIFKGSGSVTDAVDLATAEISGTLADANIIDALTINGGTINNSVIGGSTPAAGTLTTLNLSSGTANRFLVTDGSKNVAYSGSSTDFANTLTDETGTGVAVFNTAPTMAGMMYFSTGAAVSGIDYQIGRDNDGTNQLHFNGPTASTMEFSFNDVPKVLFGDSATGNIANFSCATTTTGFCINVNDADSLTSGGMARLVSNSSDSSGRNQFFVKNTNPLATGTTPATFEQNAANNTVVIDQKANGNGLLVKTVATTANSIRLTPTTQTSAAIISVPLADSLTSAGITNFVSASNDNSPRNLEYIEQSSPTATSAVTSRLVQKGLGGIQVLDRTAVSSTNAAQTINDANTGSGPSIRINKTGGGYGNNLGLIDVARTGNFTGVGGETGYDVRVAPGFTLTEPSSGTFSYALVGADLSSLSVTNDAGGASQITAGFFNGSPDADINTSYSLLTGANGKVGFNNNLVFLTGTNPTGTDYSIGKNASNQMQINQPNSGPLSFTMNNIEYAGFGPTGNFTLAPQNSVSGTSTNFLLTGSANTGMTASAENTSVNFNLARTLQWATGAIGGQREVRFQAPTYSFVGASTISNAALVSIEGAPNAGTNATITGSAALLVGGATSLASTANLNYAAVNVPSHTVTLTGNTNVTSAQGAAGVKIGQITVTDSSAVTVSNSSSLYISNAPVASGSVTLTNPYSIFVDDGATRLDGTLQVGSAGTPISAHYSGTATNLTTASISPGTCSNLGTITVTGAAVGDTVEASPDASSSSSGVEDSNLSWNAVITSANTVTIRACNPQAVGAIDAGDDQEWRADVWHH